MKKIFTPHVCYYHSDCSKFTTSLAICTLCLVGALKSQAQAITSDFKNVSFAVTASPSGKYIYTVSGGYGTLKNDRGENIAEGILSYRDGALTVSGNNGSTFVHEANTDAFSGNAFSDKEVKEFASIELSQGNRWTLEDANFYFVVEIPDFTHPQVVPSLDMSLARASIITLPRGTVKLWGYTITVEKEKGTVKFGHGKIIEASDATYTHIANADDWLKSSVNKYNDKDYIGAIADCDKAITLEPKYAKAYYDRGCSKNQLGRYAEAIADFDRTVYLDPEFKLAYTALAYNERAIAKFMVGQYSEAIADYDKLIAFGRKYPAMYSSPDYNSRGYAYYKLGNTKENYQKAIADYDTSIQLGGNDYKPEHQYREDAVAAMSKAKVPDNVEFSVALRDAANSGNVENLRKFFNAHPNLSKANRADLSIRLDIVCEPSISITASVNSTGFGSAYSTTEPLDPVSLQIAALLIAHGANVNPDSNRTAPLLGAVNGKNWLLAKLLLEKGASANVSAVGGNDNGMTPLHYAALHGNIDIARTLITHKAIVNAKDSAGFTPLHIAASKGYMQLSILLLANRANVNVKNKDGDTPLNLAVKNEHKNVAVLLRQHGGHK